VLGFVKDILRFSSSQSDYIKDLHSVLTFLLLWWMNSQSTSKKKYLGLCCSAYDIILMEGKKNVWIINLDYAF